MSPSGGCWVEMILVTAWALLESVFPISHFQPSCISDNCSQSLGFEAQCHLNLFLPLVFPNPSQILHFYLVLNAKPRGHHPWFPSFRHFTTSNLPATWAVSANIYIDNFFLSALVHWVSPKPDCHQPVSQSCFVTLDLSYEGRTCGTGSLNWRSTVSMRVPGHGPPLWWGEGAACSLLAYPDFIGLSQLKPVF